MFSKKDKSKELQLAPSNVNDLVIALAKQLGSSDAASEISGLGYEHSGRGECGYIKVETTDKLFFIFDVTKDAASKDNNFYLPYVGDVLHKMFRYGKKDEITNWQEQSAKEVVLLFPIAQ
jgi:hypothetical protein